MRRQIIGRIVFGPQETDTSPRRTCPLCLGTMDETKTYRNEEALNLHLTLKHDGLSLAAYIAKGVWSGR